MTTSADPVRPPESAPSLSRPSRRRVLGAAAGGGLAVVAVQRAAAAADLPLLGTYDVVVDETPP
ncbi:hypothetical protein [Streptomyces sp. AK04-3B]|uniref:hypothetical protein n=1 Tax=Streptomyces sp. AK04-3B TaxID=3028650 RepID=UPI0029AE8D18|nr:hypothetical protein [Streptomyces sp. AK04-3B]MDX3801912.1 hypothetical protein [Streptomyces sp. AK04-3B]